MAANNLTDLSLRAIPLDKRQRDFPAGGVPGLYVRVGARTRTFMLTVQTGQKRRRVSLGHYPEISLAKAREKARDLLAVERLKKDEPETMRFAEAYALFENLHILSMRAGSQIECSRILRKYYLPILANRPLSALKTPDLATILDRITAPSERRNAYIWLNTFMGWCYRRGYLDQNPLARLRAPTPSVPRERVLDDSELIRIWNASGEGSFGAYIRLLILTGQRKGQWLHFLPQFIQNDTIVWPAAQMKSARPHTIPLTPIIHGLIGNHTFGGWDEPRRKRQLDAVSGTSGWTIHDLRRSFATRLAEQGTPPHIIERLLAHSRTISGVAATYNRASYLPEMREALQRYATRLFILLST